jgi:hypothetical protein
MPIYQKFSWRVKKFIYMNVYPKHGKRVLDLPAQKRKFYKK